MSSFSGKKIRNMKVVSQSGYKYREIPTITLKGLWLGEAGFSIGDYVTVSCEEGKLVITPRENTSFVEVFEAQQLCMVAEEGAYLNE